MHLRELIEFQKPSAVERDAAGGVRVRGVKLIGLESRNVNNDGTRNRYVKSALDAAAPLYESRPVYRNHDRNGGERRVEDKLGKITAVESREDGLYGDMLLAPGPDADRVAWAAEHAPDFLAMSHHARGLGTKNGEWTDIEQIEAVRSVDLVAAGGTTFGLFESANDNPQPAEDSVKFSDLTAELLREHRPDLVESLAPEAPAATEVTVTESAPEAPEPAESVEVVESAPEVDPRIAELQEQLQAMRADAEAKETRARRQQMLTESKLPLDKVAAPLLEPVYEAASDEKAAEVIEALRAAYFHQDPVGSVPTTDHHDDSKAFAAWIES